MQEDCEIEERDKIISEIKIKLQGVHSDTSENIIRDIEKRSKTSQGKKNEIKR